MRPSSDSDATIKQWTKLFENKIKMIENTLSCHPFKLVKVYHSMLL